MLQLFNIKLMRILRKFGGYRLFEFILLLIAFFYYLFFVNKGLVFFDEGYFVHAADRILGGEIPYKDFSLQYGPIYFYILALVFKLFGTSIITERFFTLSICLLILLITFLILNKLRVKSYPIITLSFLCVTAFGFPLINIPNIMWANVLTTLVCILVYLYWYSAHNRLQFIYLSVLGIFLALAFSFKQNIGIATFVTLNFLILFSKKRLVSHILRDLGILNVTFLIFTMGWIYYFFLKDNIQGLFIVIEFGRKFTESMAFTIPPLTYILQPFGALKLLPYYTPIAFGLFIFSYLLRYKKDWQKLAFALNAVTGFAVTIFPQSDLLHVYPFLGSILVCIIIFGYKSRLRFFIICFVFLNVLIGFYLTLFTKSYRYEAPYSKMTTAISLPRTSGILIEKNEATNLVAVSNYIKSHTRKNEYIFVYPYAPMLYFVFERKNPTKDPIYYIRNWHFYDDTVALKDIRQKNVKFIIASGAYKFDTDLSRFIQRQKEVFRSGSLIVFRTLPL